MSSMIVLLKRNSDIVSECEAIQIRNWIATAKGVAMTAQYGLVFPRLM